MQVSRKVGIGEKKWGDVAEDLGRFQPVSTAVSDES